MLLKIRDYLKNNLKSILFFFIIGLFIIDIIVNININYFDRSLSRLSGYYKLLFEFFFVFLIVINKPKKVKLLIIFSCVFIFGQILSLDFLPTLNNKITKGNLYYFDRYIYVFIFASAMQILEDKNETYKAISKIFAKVMLINSVIIVLGLIFEITLFKSYPHSARFGYDGIFVKDGDAAYMYIIYISYLYSIYINNKKPVKLFKLISIILISLLLGKKVIILFLFFLLLHFIYNTKFKKLVLPFSILALVSGLAFYEKILSFFPFMESFYFENGLVTSIFSTRDLSLKESFIFIEDNWSFQNYLFGSIEYIKNRVELELFDLLFFFGVIGTLVYFYMFYKNFFKNNNKLLIQLIIIILLTSLFSGALLISVPSLLFLYIVLVRKKQNNSLNLQKLNA